MYYVNEYLFGFWILPLFFSCLWKTIKTLKLLKNNVDNKNDYAKMVSRFGFDPTLKGTGTRI